MKKAFDANGRQLALYALGDHFSTKNLKAVVEACDLILPGDGEIVVHVEGNWYDVEGADSLHTRYGAFRVMNIGYKYLEVRVPGTGTFNVQIRERNGSGVEKITIERAT